MRAECCNEIQDALRREQISAHDRSVFMLQPFTSRSGRPLVAN